MKKIYAFAVAMLTALTLNAQIAVTCAEAAALMPSESGTETESTYVVTGYVTNTNGIISPSRTDASIDRQTFYMDDFKGSQRTIQGYWCNLPGHEALNVGDKISVAGRITNYNNTPEIVNGDVTILERVTVVIDTFNVTVCEAITEGNNLNNKAYSSDVFRVYGRLTSADQVNNYGQHTFEMACGSSIFKPYNCAAASGVTFNTGDSVVVIGKLFNYNGTIEISAGSITLLEKVTTVEEAKTIAMNLPQNGYTDYNCKITGYVDSVVTPYNEQYGNITFFMTDDMSNLRYDFEVYRGRISAADAALCVKGSKVTVTGKLQHYCNASQTFEMAELATGGNVVVEYSGQTVLPSKYWFWMGYVDGVDIANVQEGNSNVFENGISSITVQQDGYLFVVYQEIGVAGVQYMSEWYVYDQTHATMTTTGMEKIHIPAGTWTLYLYDNGDGTVELAYQPMAGKTLVSDELTEYYTVTVNARPSYAGSVNVTYNADHTQATLTAIPYEGYHFVSWSDGNTTNPRTIVLTSDVSLSASFIPEGHHFVYSLDLTSQATSISDWTIMDATLNPSYSDEAVGKYAYDVYEEIVSESYVTSNPDISFKYKNASGKQKAFCIYPGNCFEFNGKNGILSIKNTLAGDRILITCAAKGSTMASLADDYAGYHLNAVAITEDLTLPAKGSSGADEQGYTWREIEFESLGGDVEIKECMAGYRVKNVEVIRSDNYTVTANASPWDAGTVEVTYNADHTQATLTAIPYEGYHFVSWSDGNTTNPRTIVLTSDVSLSANFIAEGHHFVSSLDLTSQATSISDWTIMNATLNPSYSDEAVGKYAFDVYGEIVSESYVTSNPDISFKYKNGADKQKAFCIYPGNCFEFNGKNGILSIKNTLAGDRILITCAAKGSTMASFADDNFVYPKNAIAITEDLTLPAKGSSGADEQGYTWREIEFESLGGDVEIREFNAGYRVKKVEVIHSNNYTVTANASPWDAGTVEVTYNADHTQATMTAIPNEGYRFDHWNDGNTENPRTVVLTQDASFMAIFEHDDVYVTYIGMDGKNLGVETVAYGSSAQQTGIDADEFGYTLTGWDKDLSSVTENMTVTASYTRDAINGFYYIFDRENRTAVLDREGNSYAKIKTLNVPNHFIYRGTYFAVVAVGANAFEGCTRLTDVVLPSNVEDVFESAFSGCSDMVHLTMSAGLRSIADYAFNGCKRLEDITVYAERVPDLTATSFNAVGNKKYINVYVPDNRVNNYKRDDYWSEFNIVVKSAEIVEGTVEDVAVQPEETTAQFTWPTESSAGSYTIQITKDGEVFCTLIFNANGQLTGIAFAPGRDGNRAPAATTTANGGMQFTVTGLDAGTTYAYTVTTKDTNERVIATYEGSFETNGTMEDGIEDVQTSVAPKKIVRDGQIYILRGEKVFTLQGVEVK